MRSLAVATSIITSVLFANSAARAEVTVCNEFQTTIHVAFASQDNSAYRTTGWWAVAKDACQPIDFTVAGDTLYYTADSDSYRDGRQTKRDHWGNKIKLYVGRNQFDFADAEKSRRGAKAQMFSTAATTMKNPAITVHFKSGGTSIDFKTAPATH